MSQIAAEELGVGLDDIKTIFGDTETTPIEIGSQVGAAAYCTGNAVKAAAAEAKQQLFEIVAAKLEANAEDLEANDRRIYVTGTPERGISFSDAVTLSIQRRGGDPIIGKGSYKAYPEADSYPNTKTAEGLYTPAVGFSASVAEVEVNADTGEVRLLKVTTADDCGFCLNPQGLQGQIEGQTYMGKGITLSEEVIMEKGKVFNPSFLGYECFTSLDTTEVETIIVESMEPRSAFGCKEAGEAAIAGMPGAIANAIYDAVGVRFKEFPITPEKILEALQKKGK
jgi:CO/xanthine dehydrogenase Mo-binding subunit